MNRRIPNNQDQIASRINAQYLKGVHAIPDDGSVIVEVKGDEERVQEVAAILYEQFGDRRIGDGVQEGSLWINADEAEIHDDVENIVVAS